ncbi:MAG: Putative transcriptional regulator, AsnC family [Desulfotomaculum sp. 46_296]|nr:MAG: Putative transcriptional regulator, AsnC family [Desulfotomaculum sp. 46_296]HAU32639.1 Lrp/AsnC family transcriptional regulator [Desulfotomaculum sp.]
MLSEQEKELVRELQKGLPLVSRPFRDIADRLGVCEEEVVAKVKDFLARGIIRRFGAVVKHHDVGYVANAMVVWPVPEERIKEVGRVMASFPEVTHCYNRPSAPGWPYTLYTVIHGKKEQDCRSVAEKISLSTGITGYRILFSTAELKKSSMEYFLD